MRFLSIRSFFLTLLTAFAIRATASAQTRTAAAPVAIEPRIAFGGGDTRALALRNNGDVLTWGDHGEWCSLGRQAVLFKTDPTPGVVMHNVKEIAASGYMNLALTVDGKVYSWGQVTMGSGYYPCDGPAPVASLAGKVVTHIGVSTGFYSPDNFAVAVTDTGDLYCWGNSYSCPANQTRNPDSSFRGGDADPVKTFTRLNLPELQGNVLDVRLGMYHTLVLTKDRKLYAFGRSRWGQLGDSRFTQGGAVFGFTPEPVLTNVVSFAAGTWHSVAVKYDGTVWTWGHNEDYELCDGSTTTRRVPTQLTSLAGQVVQVASSGRSTLMKTKTGVIYGCGSNRTGQLGLDRPKIAGQGSDPSMVPQPTQVPVPAANSSLLVVGDQNSAFSPDGCTVYIAGEGGMRSGLRGATDPSSPRFAPRAGLSLCAPRPATPLPDVAAGALHPAAPAPSGVDCWIPKREDSSKDARLAPMRQALLTAERLVKENEAFIPQLPEGVRMWIENSMGWLSAYAFPRQAGPFPQWTSTSCNVLDVKKASAIGRIDVIFNGGLSKLAPSFTDLKPSRTVAGFPVYRTATREGPIDDIVITQDGRLPVIPVTLGDQLDSLTEFARKSLADVRKELAEKAPASAEAGRRLNETHWQREVEALRAYRASFSAEELRAAWVEGDPNGPEKRQLDAHIRGLETLLPGEQAQVNALGERIRALQLQARTRGVQPQEAARLRNEANDLLNQGAAIRAAHQARVQSERLALLADSQRVLIRPGDASQSRHFKDDPTFFDKSDPSRIRMIVVHFIAGSSRATSGAQAKAWMDKVESTFDYAALKALIR